MSKAGTLAMMAMACWSLAGAIPLKAAEPAKIRIGGNVQASRIVSQPKPVYPPEAKAARIQGTVQLTVEIAADGKVKDVSLISGPPGTGAVRGGSGEPVGLPAYAPEWRSSGSNHYCGRQLHAGSVKPAQ
jgi:hypothetical protein